jgi:hypothetical protein
MRAEPVAVHFRHRRTRCGDPRLLLRHCEEADADEAIQSVVLDRHAAARLAMTW